MRMTVALVVFGVLLLLSSFYFGLKFFDGKVEKDTYEAALNYDKQKKLISRYEIDAVFNSVVFDGVNVRLEGSLKSNKKVKLNSLKLESPSSRLSIKQNFEIKDENFVLQAEGLNAGNYIVIFELIVDNETLRFEKAIYIKK